jgi:hypothetical protein
MSVNVRYLCIIAASIVPAFSSAQDWVARYNGPGNAYDAGSAIVLDVAGKIYVTGGSTGSGTGFDSATVKYDASGVEQWVTRYDGSGSDRDQATAIAIDAAGNIYVTGYSAGSGTAEDYVTIKYNSLGVEQWVMRYDAGLGDFGNDIAVDGTGNVYVTGRSWGPSNNDDYVTIKYSATGIEENRSVAKKRDDIIAAIFSGPLRLPQGKKCAVYDIAGRVVEPEGITRGIYFLEIEDRIVQKIVKVR